MKPGVGPRPARPDRATDEITERFLHYSGARGIGCEAWEQEIDARVAALYGIGLKDIEKPGR